MKLKILKCLTCGKVIYTQDKERVCSWCGGNMKFVEFSNRKYKRYKR